jgi:uncharacterized protein YjbI with pentapeptide repeats
MPYSCPGCDLTKHDFSGQDLTGANLRGANVIRANFTGATLAGADFTGATISETNFTGCNLSTTIFGTPARLVAVPGKLTVLQKATVPFSTLRLAWSDLDLRGATIMGLPADLSRLQAARARLDGLDLSNKTMRNAVLTGASLTRARLNRTTLDYAVFFGATLTGATFAGATFVQTDLTQTNLTGTVFDGCDVTPCRFSAPPRFSRDAASLTSFKGATIDLRTLGLNWSFLDLSDATIVGLDGVTDLSGLLAESTVLTTLDLSRRVLDGAVFRHATLRGTKFQKARLNGATLIGAACVGADFTSTLLSNCHASDADFSHATLDSAFFDGATLVGARLASVHANGVQFGGLAPAFQIDPSQEAALRSGSVSALIPLFRQSGYQLSASAIFAQTSGTWIAADGGSSYTIVLVSPATGLAQLTLYSPKLTADLPLSAVATLNSGTPAQVQTLFAQAGVVLSPSAQLTRAAAVWTVVDGGTGRNYTIRKDPSATGMTITVFTAVSAAVMTDVYMPDAVLTNANFYGVSGDGLQLYGSGKLDGAILEAAQLANANLGGMDLTNARLLGAVLSGATLVNANLHGATLTPSAGGVRVDLTGANLQGADFTGATLYDANLTNAAVAVPIETGEQDDAGVWLLDLDESIAGELDPASARITLATGAADCTALQQAFDQKDRTTVAAAMKKKGLKLSPAATISQDGHVMVWRIVAGSSVVFTIVAGLDAQAMNEYFVTPAPPAARFSLNPGGSTTAFAAIGDALQRRDLTALGGFFTAQGRSLPDNAELVDGKIGNLWSIADTPGYDAWATVDQDLQPIIVVRRALTGTTDAFAKAGITLRQQATVDKWTAPDFWIVDNDSGNANNTQIGYMKFACIPGDARIDVYGTEVHIERLAGDRLEIVVLQCDATTLDEDNLSGNTVCPNGIALQANQSTYGTKWREWMRGRHPPAPPICVPNAQSYCPVNTGRRERLLRTVTAR